MSALQNCISFRPNSWQLIQCWGWKKLILLSPNEVISRHTVSYWKESEQNKSTRSKRRICNNLVLLLHPPTSQHIKLTVTRTYIMRINQGTLKILQAPTFWWLICLSYYELLIFYLNRYVQIYLTINHQEQGQTSTIYVILTTRWNKNWLQLSWGGL